MAADAAKIRKEQLLQTLGGFCRNETFKLKTARLSGESLRNTRKDERDNENYDKKRRGNNY